MLIPFETLKVIQASAVLLKTVPSHRMSRMRLLKLLYIADRETLKATGRPITGDRVAAMTNGPVLSQTYHLIKGAEFASPVWEKHLKRSGLHDVRLAAEPGVGQLAKHEIEKLQDVAARFAHMDDWDVADYTHDFQEYKKNEPPKGSRNMIPLEDILDAVGLSQHKHELVNDAYRLKTVARLLSDSESECG